MKYRIAKVVDSKGIATFELALDIKAHITTKKTEAEMMEDKGMTIDQLNEYMCKGLIARFMVEMGSVIDEYDMEGNVSVELSEERCKPPRPQPRTGAFIKKLFNKEK